MDRLETLIDNLMIYLPADMPILASLMQRSEGVVQRTGCGNCAFRVWTLLAVLQTMFFGPKPQPVAHKTRPIELSEPTDSNIMPRLSRNRRWV